MKRFLIWEELTITWETVPYLWEDVAVLVEAFELLGSGRIPEEDPWKEIKRKLPPKLAKKFLDIIVRVNGEVFKETREIEEEKEMTVKNVKTVTGPGINVTTEDEIFKNSKDVINTKKITIDHIKRTFDMFGASKIIKGNDESK